MSPEAAIDWVKQFKKDGRYQRDVYWAFSIYFH
jgi:sulfite reductase alpha subunit-like flavoprotein